MSKKITVKNTSNIHASREAVWDYTQDYACRPDWDFSIRSGDVIAVTPHRLVKIRARFGLCYAFRYKAFDRPRRTSLAIVDSNSPFVLAGGGSWRYDAIDGGTRWTQVNSIVMPNRWYIRVGQPLLTLGIKAHMAITMRVAKYRIERGKTAPKRPRNCPFSTTPG